MLSNDEYSGDEYSGDEYSGDEYSGEDEYNGGYYEGYDININKCCFSINKEMKKLLLKYYNTDVKIVEIVFKYIDNISIIYNVSKDKILNYKLYHWYYGNFLNGLLKYMFMPCLFVNNLNLSKDFKLNDIQIHDLIYHIYKLVVYNKCKLYIIDYYNNTLIDILNQCNNSESVSCNAKKYIPILKIIFKYGHNLINKQQKLIRKKLVKILYKKRCLRIISNFVSNIIWNPEYKLGHKRIKSLSDNFYNIKLDK